MTEIDSNDNSFFTCEEETWFSILSRSRDPKVNSKSGAWDSKTYWIKRGLDKCLNSDVVKACTLKSLGYHFPRENLFKLNREHTSDRKKYSKQGITDINSMREDWIATILFDNYQKKNTFYGYNILSYEIPLGRTIDNQLFVDLLSINKSDKKIGLIELKQANNESNSPLLALVELICYGIQFIKSQEFILSEMKKSDPEIDSEYFNKIGLFLTAPEMYWNCWRVHDFKSKLEEVVTVVNTVLLNEGKPTFLLEFYMVDGMCNLIRS